MNLEDKDIEEIVVKESQKYLNRFGLHYVFDHHQYEVNTKVTFYKAYEHYFIFDEKYMHVNVDIIEYEDGHLTLFFHVKKYNERGKYFEVTEYFRQHKKLDYRDKFIISNYAGETLSEKLVNFFTWLMSVTDKQLIKIFKGEDWVDVPFDWGDLR